MEAAAEIARISEVRSFPDDYMSFGNAGRIEIPVGTEILMFRQDENVVVSIDGKRIYLRAYDEAKYIFYSAKRGQKFVHNPAGLDLQNPIRKFEDDLDRTQRMIEERSSVYSGKMKDMLRRECSRLLGYNDIF